MKNTGITIFLNGEKVSTGDYSMTCREDRLRTVGKHEGDGPKERLELEVEVRNCHTDLTDGKVSVSFFGVMFDGIISDRTTRFKLTENWPNLHNFTVVLLPQSQHYVG